MSPSTGDNATPGAAGRLDSRQRLLIGLALLALVGTTLLLRTWQLNETPPGLWWDEATQGLDAGDILHGQFRMFYARAEGKEPLYVYLSAPIVAAWYGEPFAVRLAGGITGALMVLALFFTARALWRDNPTAGAWAGLAAGGLWAVNYWPQSINRIGFQVNALPLVLTLAVAAWLNWTWRPVRGRAVTFGLLAGLTLTTYLASRFTPVLWLLLFAVLPATRRRTLRATLPWALLGFAVLAVPLALHFLLHPEDFVSRVGVFPLLSEHLTPPQMVNAAWFNVKKVAGAFLGWAGDPVLRHNIPDRPAFSPFSAALVALGIGAALLSLWRPGGFRRNADSPARRLRADRPERGWPRQRAATLLLWLAVMSVPALLAMASNPHFPRLFGALPAALLLAAWPVASAASWLKQRNRALPALLAAGLLVLLVFEGARTVNAYFVTWRTMDLFEAYQEDFTLLGRRIAQTPDAIAVVPMNTEAGDIFDYAFRDAPIHQVRLDTTDPEQWLAETLAGAGSRPVLLPVWNQGPHVFADAKGVFPFYLEREGELLGEEPLRAVDLRVYQLGEHQQFSAPGIQRSLNAVFNDDVTLVGARWGAASPNLDRSGDTAMAGSQFWVELTWQLARPLTDLRAAVDLVDPAGHRLGSADDQLLRLNPDDPPVQWPPHTLVKTRHLVSVPATQLPGPVGLEVRLYDSATLQPIRAQGGTVRGSVALDRAQVSEPPAGETVSTIGIDRPSSAAMPGDVTFLGSESWPEIVSPGQRLALRLFWQASDEADGEHSYLLSLGDTGIRAAFDLPATLPAGRPFHVYADLALPPDAPQGVFDLVLRADDSDGPRLVLGTVQIEGRSRLFEAPPLAMPLDATFGADVALLGVDLPAQLAVAAGQTITATLVWQALDTPGADLVRFVHLLDETGTLQAQSDGVPCAGDCPSPSWLAGEVLVDDVRLTLPDDLPPGSYRLATGWYDSGTVTRLPASDAAGQPLADDLLVLPLEIRGSTPPAAR